MRWMEQNNTGTGFLTSCCIACLLEVYGIVAINYARYNEKMDSGRLDFITRSHKAKSLSGSRHHWPPSNIFLKTLDKRSEKENNIFSNLVKNAKSEILKDP